MADRKSPIIVPLNRHILRFSWIKDFHRVLCRYIARCGHILVPLGDVAVVVRRNNDWLVVLVRMHVETRVEVFQRIVLGVVAALGGRACRSFCASRLQRRKRRASGRSVDCASGSRGSRWNHYNLCLRRSCRRGSCLLLLVMQSSRDRKCGRGDAVVMSRLANSVRCSVQLNERLDICGSIIRRSGAIVGVRRSRCDVTITLRRALETNVRP